MTDANIAGLVEQHLKGLPIKASVVADGIRREGEWWTVPVCAAEDQQPSRRWRYYEMLAGIESEIEEEDGIKILLVPVSEEAVHESTI